MQESWKERKEDSSEEECHHKSTRYRNGDTRFSLSLMPEDGYLLLCSDGLSNMISDEELKELLLDHSQIANKVNQMIARANEYGGKDNISLVIVDLKR